MGGALLFTAVLVTVLVLGTYVLQAAILLLWLALLAVRAAVYVFGALVFCVWWVFQPREAAAALRRAEAQAALRPGGSARRASGIG